MSNVSSEPTLSDEPPAKKAPGSAPAVPPQAPESTPATPSAGKVSAAGASPAPASDAVDSDTAPAAPAAPARAKSRRAASGRKTAANGARPVSGGTETATADGAETAAGDARPATGNGAKAVANGARPTVGGADTATADGTNTAVGDGGAATANDAEAAVGDARPATADGTNTAVGDARPATANDAEAAAERRADTSAAAPGTKPRRTRKPRTSVLEADAAVTWLEPGDSTDVEDPAGNAGAPGSAERDAGGAEAVTGGEGAGDGPLAEGTKRDAAAPTAEAKTGATAKTAAEAESAEAKTAEASASGAGDDSDETGAMAGRGDESPANDKSDGDPFTAFAPEPELVPGRVGRISRRSGSLLVRFFTHEWTLAAIGSLILAIAMTWPAIRHPATTIPQDIWDPTLQAWQMAWAGHILTTDPLQLWHANAFYPDQYSYAFSDTLLGYAPAGMIGTGPEAAVVRYNFVFIFIFAFAFFGAYALVRQLGAGRTGAAVAGAAFAYAPWRLGQAGHLHVLSIGGIALSLAMLARGHGFSLTKGYEPEKRRWGWVVGGWLVAAWQISLGFGIGIPFAYALLIAVLASAITWGYRQLFRWKERRPFGWKLLAANLGGGLAFAGVSAMMAYPYLQVLKQHKEAKRSAEIISLFSPPLKGFFISPPESWLWGDAYANARSTLGWAPEMALLPGFFLYGLAFAGLFVSVWKLQHRILLGVGVVLTAMLAMGSNGPGKGDYGYMALYRVLPGFEGIRTSGRLMVWVTLFLALLAAGAVSAFASRAVELFADQTQSDVGNRAGAWRLITIIPLVLVLAEGVHKWQPSNPEVPPAPVAMSTLEAPLMVLPTGELQDMNIMLWSTDGLPKMVNGGSGFTPDDQQILRLNMQQFPDEATVAQLRDLKVHTVVVLRDRAQGTEYAKSIDAPIDGLGISRTEQGNVILYKIDG